MPSSDPRSERRFPRLATAAVGVVALVIVGSLVQLAWRSSSESRAESAEARAEEAEAARVLRPGGDPFKGCTECHGDLDKVFTAGLRPGLLYTHAEHFEAGVSDCAMCHPANTHEPDLINRPTMGRCSMCHGTTEVAIAPGACETCHPPDFPRLPKSHQAAGWLDPPPGERAAHGQEAKLTAIECATCHEEPFCASCHGVDEMPHPEGWEDEPHVLAFFDGADGACERCHQRAPEVRDSCDSCHHPSDDEQTPWQQAHPATVKADGARSCFDCHDPTTCATCHVRGEETFDADRAVFEATRTPTTRRER